MPRVGFARISAARARERFLDTVVLRWRLPRAREDDAARHASGVPPLQAMKKSSEYKQLVKH